MKEFLVTFISAQKIRPDFFNLYTLCKEGQINWDPENHTALLTKITLASTIEEVDCLAAGPNGYQLLRALFIAIQMLKALKNPEQLNELAQLPMPSPDRKKELEKEWEVISQMRKEHNVLIAKAVEDEEEFENDELEEDDEFEDDTDDEEEDEFEDEDEDDEE